MSIEEVSKYKSKFWPRSSHTASNSKGQSGGLITLWDSSMLDCSLDMVTDNWMAVVCKCQDSDFVFGLINVYAPQTLQRKAECWQQISHWLDNQNGLPCSVAGDFYAIRALSEKQGGSCQLEQRHILFNDFIKYNQLIEPMIP